MLQLLKPGHLEPMFCNKRSHRSEKPVHHKKEQPLLAATRESSRAATETQRSQKKKKKRYKILLKLRISCAWPPMWPVPPSSVLLCSSTQVGGQRRPDIYWPSYPVHTVMSGLSWVKRFSCSAHSWSVQSRASSQVSLSLTFQFIPSRLLTSQLSKRPLPMSPCISLPQGTFLDTQSGWPGAPHDALPTRRTPATPAEDCEPLLSIFVPP